MAAWGTSACFCRCWQHCCFCHLLPSLTLCLPPTRCRPLKNLPCVLFTSFFCGWIERVFRLLSLCAEWRYTTISATNRPETFTENVETGVNPSYIFSFFSNVCRTSFSSLSFSIFVFSLSLFFLLLFMSVRHSLVFYSQYYYTHTRTHSYTYTHYLTSLAESWDSE